MKIAKIFDANVYVNNVSAHGKATEITCPEITFSTTEIKALGMPVGMKVPTGHIEPMEATIKWAYADNETLKACSNFSKPIDIMARASKVIYSQGGEISEEVPVVVYLKGSPIKHVTGSYKRGEDTEYETTISVYYCKQEVDGEDIIEVDALNCIYKVDGEDLLAERNSNLGL